MALRARWEVNMRNERLTTTELDKLRNAFPTHMGETEMSVLVQDAVFEIIDRRANDLTSENKETLRWCRALISETYRAWHGHCFEYERAVALLERLIVQAMKVNP